MGETASNQGRVLLSPRAEARLEVIVAINPASRTTRTVLRIEPDARSAGFRRTPRADGPHHQGAAAARRGTRGQPPEPEPGNGSARRWHSWIRHSVIPAGRSRPGEEKRVQFPGNPSAGSAPVPNFHCASCFSRRYTSTRLAAERNTWLWRGGGRGRGRGQDDRPSPFARAPRDTRLLRFFFVESSALRVQDCWAAV